MQFIQAQNMEWLALMSKNSDYYSDAYIEETYLTDLTTEITRYWDARYSITNLEYANGKWNLVMAGSTYETQAYYHKETFPKEWVAEKWEESYVITEIAFGEGVWFVVMSKGASYTADKWKVSADFSIIEKTIAEYWDKGYYITNLQYGANDYWALSMGKHPKYNHQTYYVVEKFPKAWIEEKWEKDYDITEIEYVDNNWIIIMSRGGDYSQIWQSDTEFPKTWFAEKLEEGYSTVDIVYGDRKEEEEVETVTTQDLRINEVKYLTANFIAQSGVVYTFNIDDVSQVNNSILEIYGSDFDIDYNGDYTEFTIVINDSYVIVDETLNKYGLSFSANALIGFKIKDYLKNGENKITIMNVEPDGSLDFAYIGYIQLKVDEKYYASYSITETARNLNVSIKPDDMKVNYLAQTDDYTVVNIENTGILNSCITNTTYIIDKETDIKYYLQNTDNIILCENEKFEYSSNFNLYFDKLPSTVSNINIIEDETDTYAYNFYNITFELKQEEIVVATLPPILNIDKVSFSESVLDANETAQLTLMVSNFGPGDANNVYVKLSGIIQGIDFPTYTYFPVIKANGGSQTVIIDIKASEDVTNGEAKIQMEIVEPNFKVTIQGKQLVFATKEFNKPNLVLAKYAVLENQSANPNNRIDLNEMIDLQFAIQNTGYGNALDVNVSVKNKQKGVMFLGVVNGVSINSKNPNFASIQSGNYEVVNYRYFVNSEFSEKELIFEISANETSNTNGFTESKIFPINSTLSTADFTVEISNTEEVNNNTNLTISNVPDFEVDVDINIPVTGVENTHAYALIIGNEDYKSKQNGISQEQNVAFAINDARVFAEYCEKTIGIPNEQIKVLENATAAEISQALAWLNNLARIENGKAELFFYYSGHGLPHQETKEAYIIPVDVSGLNLEYAIKLEDIYKKLSEHPVKRATVFLDACFSGGARNESLVMAKSGIKLKPKESHIKSNLIIFASSSGKESSSVYDEKHHGYFTYFLLKKIQETKGDVSYDVLSDYLIAKVSKATALKSKQQTPKIIISPEVDQVWKSWKIK